MSEPIMVKPGGTEFEEAGESICPGTVSHLIARAADCGGAKFKLMIELGLIPAPN